MGPSLSEEARARYLVRGLERSRPGDLLGSVILAEEIGRRWERAAEQLLEGLRAIEAKGSSTLELPALAGADGAERLEDRLEGGGVARPREAGEAPGALAERPGRWPPGRGGDAAASREPRDLAARLEGDGVRGRRGGPWRREGSSGPPGAPWLEGAQELGERALPGRAPEAPLPSPPFPGAPRRLAPEEELAGGARARRAMPGWGPPGASPGAPGRTRQGDAGDLVRRAPDSPSLEALLPRRGLDVDLFAGDGGDGHGAATGQGAGGDASRSAPEMAEPLAPASLPRGGGEAPWRPRRGAVESPRQIAEHRAWARALEEWRALEF